MFIPAKQRWCTKYSRRRIAACTDPSRSYSRGACSSCSFVKTVSCESSFSSVPPSQSRNSYGVMFQGLKDCGLAIPKLSSCISWGMSSLCTTEMEDVLCCCSEANPVVAYRRTGRRAGLCCGGRLYQMLFKGGWVSWKRLGGFSDFLCISKADYSENLILQLIEHLYHKILGIQVWLEFSSTRRPSAAWWQRILWNMSRTGLLPGHTSAMNPLRLRCSSHLNCYKSPFGEHSFVYITHVYKWIYYLFYTKNAILFITKYKKNAKKAALDNDSQPELIA